MDNCPLCGSPTTVIKSASLELKLVAGIERFYRCESCHSVHVPERFHLTEAQELERYALHENNDSDSGYRNYLSGVIGSIEKLTGEISGFRVLDYGSGENAVMTAILKERGIEASAYDPNYESLSTIDGQFDLIIACESSEHFRFPRKEFEKILAHLKPEGYLYLRTELLDSTPYFSAWYYKNDPTHIFFYSKRTFEYLADQFGLELVDCNGKNSTLLRRKPIQ